MLLATLMTMGMAFYCKFTSTMQVQSECYISVIYHLSKMAADCTHFAEDLRMTKNTKSCTGSWLMAGESPNLLTIIRIKQQHLCLLISAELIKSRFQIYFAIWSLTLHLQKSIHVYKEGGSIYKYSTPLSSLRTATSLFTSCKALQK